MQWHDIDWVLAHRMVRRLQERIVKATRESRWGKVKALQYLLTRSLSGETTHVTRKVLKQAVEVKIDHHYVKVQAEANFYDPAWDDYFEKRITSRMEQTVAGRKRIAALWSRQEGRCLACGELITEETGWHVHHVFGRQVPNANSLSKLQLLHPNCHMQTHFRKTLS
jgi:hypothetical protein